MQMRQERFIQFWSFLRYKGEEEEEAERYKMDEHVAGKI